MRLDKHSLAKEWRIKFRARISKMKRIFVIMFTSLVQAISFSLQKRTQRSTLPLPFCAFPSAKNFSTKTAFRPLVVVMSDQRLTLNWPMKVEPAGIAFKLMDRLIVQSTRTKL